MPARCRLYLVAPDKFELDSFALELPLALAAGDVASFLLRMEGASEADARSAARVLMPLTHARDVAFLIANRPSLAAELGADGVHLDQADADIAAARRLLGQDRILGVNGGSSRHRAMEAAEQGADYVALAADPELIAWWSELMIVPSVAMGGVTLENCAALVAAGADFVAAGSTVWDCPAGPAAAIRDFNAAIAKAQAG